MDDDKVFTTVVEVPAPTTPMKKKEKTAACRLSSFLPSVDEVFKWAPFQLPVTMSSKGQGIKQKQKQRQSKSMPLLSVKMVLGWALITAGCVAATLAITVVIVLANIDIPCSETSNIFQRPHLTPEQRVEVHSNGKDYLLFTVPQAAAAIVGLLLPRRHARSRWSLAIVSIVSATIAHYMFSRETIIFIASNPGAIGQTILGSVDMVGLLAGDLFSILSLLIGGPE